MGERHPRYGAAAPLLYPARGGADDAPQRFEDVPAARIDGVTAQLLRSAPQRAAFVWHHASLAYPVALARKLGRSDLVIVGPSWLDSQAPRAWTRDVVLDHATLQKLSPAQLHAYERFLNLRRAELARSTP